MSIFLSTRNENPLRNIISEKIMNVINCNEANTEGSFSTIFPSSKIDLKSSFWEELEKTLKKNRTYFKQCHTGDTDERHDLLLAQFCTDVSEHIITKFPDSKTVVKQIDTEFGPILNQILKAKLYLQRCQAHILLPGGFIGCHVDAEYDASYVISVIFHLNCKYLGGEFVIYDGDLRNSKKLNTRSVVLLDPILPHEVETVESGERITIATFWSYKPTNW